MAQSAFFAYLTLFLREVAQASLPVASLCFGLAQGAAVVGRVSWGVVSDRLFGGRRKIVIVLIGLTGAAALSAMPAAGLGPVLAVGAPLAVVCGLTIAAYGGLLQTAVVESADSRLAGAAIGYHLSFVSISQMVGLPLFGAVVDWSGHYATGWLIFAGLLLLSTLLIARFFQERRP
jgi:sugar phosphate permease